MCVLGSGSQERASHEEEYSRMRKQEVQRSWGKNRLGIFLVPKESQCGQGRVTEGERGMRGRRSSERPDHGKPCLK